ncbi:MAG: hypothetical protein WKG03_09120, partial [Telluria sp.]
MQGQYETYSGAHGLIIASGDQNGIRLSYTYNAGYQLISVRDASADDTYFDYTAGNLTRIRTVEAGTNREYSRVSYGYDAQNRLQ